MPLSIEKLQGFLESKDYLVSKYFTMDGTCFFLELFDTNTGTFFLLYIPTKYEIPLEKGENVYKIKYIEMETELDETNNANVQEVYGSANIHLSPNKNKIEEHLETNYKHPITWKDIQEEDIYAIKSIHNQLKRLKYCVQNIKYKVGIIFKNYICAIRRDDSINCIYIKHYPNLDEMKLYVIVDLETLYEKDMKLIQDILAVKQGIYSVIQKNHFMHTNLLRRMSGDMKDIISMPENTLSKKEEYQRIYRRLNKLLVIMNKSESGLHEKIREMERKYEMSGEMYSDVDRVHERAKMNKELEQITLIKQEIVKTILQVNKQLDHLVLDTDNILFDNTVMIDKIVRNFVKLRESSK